MTDRRALEHLLLQVWETHDKLEELLAEVERHGRSGFVHSAGSAVELLWDAHDLVERATLKLHGCFSRAEVTRLQKG